METARVESYMSASPVRICTGTFTHDAKENLHTESLRCRDGPMITRRGCTIVLEVSLSSCITCPYTVALTFIPVHGPRERSSMFKATGTAKGTSNLWLSIDLPTTFPVGYYDTLISVSIRGCSEIMTHLLHNAIAVLFNPWNKGMPDTVLCNVACSALYCIHALLCISWVFIVAVLTCRWRYLHRRWTAKAFVLCRWCWSDLERYYWLPSASSLDIWPGRLSVCRYMYILLMKYPLIVWGTMSGYSTDANQRIECEWEKKAMAGSQGTLVQNNASG